MTQRKGLTDIELFGAVNEGPPTRTAHRHSGAAQLFVVQVYSDAYLYGDAYSDAKTPEELKADEALLLDIARAAHAGGAL